MLLLLPDGRVVEVFFDSPPPRPFEDMVAGGDDDPRAELIRALTQTVRLLGGGRGIVAALRSFEDSLDDAEVLMHVRTYNRSLQAAF